ncbi:MULTISPECIES: MarR family winged helix-turn-helix transcriptional regulator [Comamonas]|uniref:MarR family winged helix-turn-helix transcriptional regulator n=1 Tax=Comamonas TaxID=283 RepID=UPI00257E9EC2|nr:MULTISPECIES: MarR family transcriptional regulator [Comamonas]
MTHKKTPETAELPPAFEKTPPDALFFGHLLMRVSRTWRSVVDGRLADLGLTDTTWVPLFHLHAADQALTLKQLAQRVGLDSSTLVRVVDLLESRGLVVRETDASDRRSKSLRLTEQGLAVVADVRGKLYQVEAQVLAGMDARTISTLREGMQQLHERLACIQTQDKASV